MFDIEVKINNHNLSIGYGNRQTVLPTGSIDVDAVVIATFYGDGWNGYACTAQFWQDPGEIYEVAFDNNNTAVIPAEILAKAGIVNLAVYGTKNDTRISTNAVQFEIEQGSYTEAGAPAPTLSMFEQAVNAAVEAIINDILAPEAVDNTILAKMPAKTIKGNKTAAAAAPQDLTQTEVRELFAFVGANANRGGTAGFAPAPPRGGMNKYFRGDGTWQIPSADDILVALNDSLTELTPLSDGDSLDAAMTLINLLITACGTLESDKCDTDGNGDDITIQRSSSSSVFENIPGTPITLRALANLLSGWYTEINKKQSSFHSQTLSITAREWERNSVAKTVNGMTANALVIAEYSDKLHTYYFEQATDQLIITAVTVPSAILEVKVRWFDAPQ